MPELYIPFVKCHPMAKEPTKKHNVDAGWDLYACQDVHVYPGEVVEVMTGIRVAIPRGYVGLLWDKGGLGSKGIHRCAGVIDASFRGEIFVSLAHIDSAHRYNLI